MLPLWSCRCWSGLVWLADWLVSLVGVFIAKNPRNMFLNLSKADDDGHKKKAEKTDIERYGWLDRMRVL